MKLREKYVFDNFMVKKIKSGYFAFKSKGKFEI